MVTTSSNLRAFETAISVRSLPATFQHAILIARELGLQYLWIDSLCIVQNDTAEWKREAGKMASIFHFAYLTIAAASPNARREGLCLGGLKASMQFPVKQSPEDSDCQKLLVQDIDASGIGILRGAMKLQKSPMRKRGWIYQEQMLSCRVVHFVDDQWFWQCRSLFESEDRTYRVASRAGGMDQHQSVDRPLINFGPPHERGTWRGIDGWLWCRWISEHSHRNFKLESDSLVSLIGVTELYSKLTGDTPVVGLWNKDLVFHLGWALREPLNYRYDLIDKCLPSWSWTCIRHRLRNSLRFDHIPFPFNPNLSKPPFEPSIVWKAEVHGIDVLWEGEPFLSALKYARLRVQRVSWSSKRFKSLFAPSDNRGTELQETPAARQEDLPDCTNEDKKATQQISLLLWIQGEWKPGTDYLGISSTYVLSSFSLVLKATKKEPRQYRRIGFETDSWWFWDGCDNGGRDVREIVRQSLEPIEIVELV